MHVGLRAAAPGDCGASALSPLPTSHYHLSRESPPQLLLLISQQGGQSSWGVWERKRLRTLLEDAEKGEDKKKENRGMEGEGRTFTFIILYVMRKGRERSASGCIKGNKVIQLRL